jgi:hypothetical protein
MTSFMKSLNNPILNKRLSENAHLPFDKLMALSKVEASKGCVTLIPRPVKFSLRETAKPI